VGTPQETTPVQKYISTRTYAVWQDVGNNRQHHHELTDMGQYRMFSSCLALFEQFAGSPKAVQWTNGEGEGEGKGEEAN
jgi:hypothetical protein